MWNDLKLSFPNDTNGSRVLLTSRIYKVVSELQPNGKLHFLRQLTDGESWKLLEKKIFHQESCPPALHELVIGIAKNCKGLPLTIIIVAGILSTTEQDGWEEVAARLSSKTICGEVQCLDVLELSYKHLPDHLKPCFLYFGIFPEDQEIPVFKLTSLWISEGFVQKAETKCLEDVAVGHMMDLIDRSLVMVAKQGSTGEVETCCIHDLLREFCVAKAKEESFLHSLNGEKELFDFNEAGKLRRLCVHSEPKHFEKSRLYCPRIRCLLFFAQGYERRLLNFSFVFRICKLLRVLDLVQIEIGTTFPSEIELLVELRYLAIWCNTNTIPSSMAKLSKLETFHFKSWSVEVLLPSTIRNMKNLRHLIRATKGSTFRLSEDNLESSSNLYNLNTFDAAYFSVGPNLEKHMRKFPNIRKLRCLFFGSKESVGHCNKTVAMDFLSELESLNVYSGWHQYEFDFPLNIKKLSLMNFSWRTISTVGKLPCLEVLKLREGYMRSIIWDMEEGEFPKLRILKLVDLNVVKWTDSGCNLPCLEKLVLQNCWTLEEVPSILRDSSTLDMIELRRCPQSVVSLVREIEEEQRSMGNEDLKIVVRDSL